MKVKSFLAAKATTVDTLHDDLRTVEANLKEHVNSIPVLVVNHEGLADLKAYVDSLGLVYDNDVAVKADDFIPSQVGIIHGRSIFLEEDSDSKMRILTVTPSIILSEWVEGK